MVADYLLSYIPKPLENFFTIEDSDGTLGQSVNSTWYSSNIDIAVLPWRVVTLTFVLNRPVKVEDMQNERLTATFAPNSPLQASCKLNPKNANSVIVDVWNPTREAHMIERGIPFICLVSL